MEEEDRTIRYPNGNVFVGKVDGQGRRHGAGMMSFCNGDVYTGNFARGEKHGHGKFESVNGSTYEGEFYCGEMTGNGCLEYAGGGIYEGEFKNGKFDGFGVLTDENGIVVHNGQWKDDVEYTLYTYHFKHRFLPTISVIVFVGFILLSIADGNKSCDSLYNDIVLQPYVLLVLNVLFFMAFQWISKRYIIPRLTAYFTYVKELLCKPPVKTDQVRDKQGTIPLLADPEYQQAHPNWRTQLRIRELREGDNQFWREQSKIDEDYEKSVKFFVFTLCSTAYVCVQAVMSLDHSKSGWGQYTDLCGLLLNSGALSTLITAVRLRLIQQNVYYDSLLPNQGSTNIIALGVLPLLPAVVTHVIPGIAMYCWVMVIVCTVVHYVGRGLVQFSFRSREFDDELGLLWTEITLRLMLTFVLQSSFNYMVLVYDSPPGSAADYIHVVTNEYRYRSELYCTFTHFWDDVNSAIVFFSWIV